MIYAMPLTSIWGPDPVMESTNSQQQGHLTAGAMSGVSASGRTPTSMPWPSCCLVLCHPLKRQGPRGIPLALAGRGILEWAGGQLPGWSKLLGRLPTSRGSSALP